MILKEEVLRESHDSRRSDAERFVEALTGNVNEPVTFQTFPDSRPSSMVPQHFHGTLAESWDRLEALNRAGHGVFLMVNQGDGTGRSAKNVVALRALFTDDDGKGPTPPPSTDAAPPSIEVQSAHGAHRYWRLDPGEPLEAFVPSQKALAAHFGTDPKVHDLPRVMRLPGFFHLKDRENPFLVKLAEVRPTTYSTGALLAAYPPAPGAEEDRKNKRNASAAPTTSVPAPRGFVATMLACRRAKAYLAKVPGATQHDHGDDMTYYVAAVLRRDFGLRVEDALPLFREWNEKCSPPWSDADLVAKLEHAEKYATGKEGSKLGVDPRAFAATEDICYFVQQGRYYLRQPSGMWDTFSPLNKEAAGKHLRSMGLSGTTIKAVINNDLLPIVHGIDCAPTEEPLFAREGRVYVNTYRPSAIQPCQGDFPRITEMIATLTDGDPEAAKWLANWMAAKYQRPEVLSGTAVVFQGAQGTGKTTLGLIFAELIGKENTASISQPDLDGSFNGHFVEKLLIVADEVMSKETLKDNANILKKYVTDTPVMVNTKHVAQRPAENRSTWWFTSNSEVPVRIEGEWDRRYSVFAAMKTPAPDYTAMLRSIRTPEGGLTADFVREVEAFAYALKHHEVDKHAARTPYKNAARAAVIEAGRSSPEMFWQTVKELGIDAAVKEYAKTAVMKVVEGGVPTTTVYAAYKGFCDAEGMTHPVTNAKLGGTLRLAFPDAKRVRAAKEARPWIYVGLPLSASL